MKNLHLGQFSRAFFSNASKFYCFILVLREEPDPRPNLSLLLFSYIQQFFAPVASIKSVTSAILGYKSKNDFMRKFLIVSLFTVVVTSGIAQVPHIHLGLTTGVNTTIVMDKGLSEDPRYNATYTYKFAPIGFNFGVDFTRKFGLSLEGIKSLQGQIYQIIDVAEQVQGERRIEMSYLQLPLLLRFMSGGNSGTRANFNFGPQMSLLTGAVESVEAKAGMYSIPEGTDFATIKQEFPNAIDQGNGTYQLPSNVPSKDLLTKEAHDFKNTEFSIAASFGLDIDLSKHMYLTTQLRGTYSLSDIRNGDVYNKIKSGTADDLIAQRAVVNVGLQLGLHYMFGTTRKFQR